MIKKTLLTSIIIASAMLVTSCDNKQSKNQTSNKTSSQTNNVISIYKDGLTYDKFNQIITKTHVDNPSSKSLLNAIKNKNIALIRKLLSKRVEIMISRNLNYSNDSQSQVFVKWKKLPQGIPYLLPNTGIYGNSAWKWDLVFASLISDELAKYSSNPKETAALKSLALGNMITSIHEQITNGPNKGMIPHMDFDDETNAKFWKIPRHSSLTQPPVIAEGIFNLPNKSDRVALYPSLKASMLWWINQRLDNDLPFVIHPWETGRDAARDMDSQIFKYCDFSLDTSNNEYKSFTPDVLHSARVNILNKQQKIAPLPAASEIKDIFSIRSPDMAAFLVMSMEYTAKLAIEAGNKDDAVYFKSIAEKIKQATNSQMWDKNSKFYYSLGNVPTQEEITKSGVNPELLKVTKDGKIKTKTGSAFITLAAGIPNDDQAVALLDYLQSSESFNTVYPVPMVALDDAGFVPNEYWRGSTWININYYIIKGLIKYGDKFASQNKPDVATRFYNEAINLGYKTIQETANGFYEYYSSTNDKSSYAEGLGADNFTWSALSLNVVSLIENASNSLDKIQ